MEERLGKRAAEYHLKDEENSLKTGSADLLD